MPRFRKKPVEIEAHRWLTNGDHPADDCAIFQRPTGPNGETFDYPGEGKVVRYFRRPEPEYAGELPHDACGRTWHDHGWIDTLEGGHCVCPGDWIITGIKGERYPCKPDIFAASYEAVEA